ncbi:hypothetical protein [Nocardiopsis sp. LOL_012]|uniref:hypothetical protein n=1 Tax=Nocardiopsis sp. LOL_012 TaxID=3345409 RepID=UPI003A83BB88
MAFTERGGPAAAGRVPFGSRGACLRLLLLSGLAVAAWLAGVGVAHAETGPEAGGLVGTIVGLPEEAAGNADRAPSDDTRRPMLSETASRTASTTGALTDTVLRPTAVLSADGLDTVGTATAGGADDLVRGLARTGRSVVESADGSLGETALVDTVTTGLTDPASVTDGVAHVVPIQLPPPGTSGSAAVPEGEQQDGAETGGGPVEPVGTAAATGGLPSEAAREAARDEVARTAHDERSDDRVHPAPGASPHSAAADATGSSAPSFPAPGAAGYLMARDLYFVPQAHRVALPGDPTLVVRDAADDPSFSPD